MRGVLKLLAALLFLVMPALATIFGTVRGIVHDPQHRPIVDATVTLKAKSSDYTQTLQTDAEGQFHFDAVPLGEYSVTVSQSGFAAEEQLVTVLSGTAPVLHFELRLPTQAQSVTVSADSAPAQTESVTPTEVVSREEIMRTPGATRANSVAMITNYVPGAYMTHDQLHVRGGHQVSWLIDGVPIPNTNIASNLGPQIDPKDIDTIEMQRGSYAADFGDRTYGVFNFAARTGFERNNEGALGLGLGNFYQAPSDPNNLNNAPGDSFRDVNKESDAFVAFAWVHTFNQGLLVTASPFYHFNRADFESDPHDFPTATTDNRSSKYAGGQATLAYVKGRNNARAGIYGFGQQDDELLGVIFNDASNPNFRTPVSDSGSLVALFVEEQFRATSC